MTDTTKIREYLTTLRGTGFACGPVVEFADTALEAIFNHVTEKQYALGKGYQTDAIPVTVKVTGYEFEFVDIDHDKHANELLEHLEDAWHEEYTIEGTRDGERISSRDELRQQASELVRAAFAIKSARARTARPVASVTVLEDELKALIQEEGWEAFWAPDAEQRNV